MVGIIKLFIRLQSVVRCCCSMYPSRDSRIWYNIWGWLGFSQKDAAKRTLDKHFTINIDYKIFAPQVGGAIKNTPRGGHNKEIIMLTIRTFKLFCLKAGTKKAGTNPRILYKIRRNAPRSYSRRR